jgi:hypothetical protein
MLNTGYCTSCENSRKTVAKGKGSSHHIVKLHPIVRGNKCQVWSNSKEVDFWGTRFDVATLYRFKKEERSVFSNW